MYTGPRLSVSNFNLITAKSCNRSEYLDSVVGAGEAFLLKSPGECKKK